jgi:hypothetical protein
MRLAKNNTSIADLVTIFINAPSKKARFVSKKLVLCARHSTLGAI